MLRDLQGAGKADPLNADLVVVGAGIAGLIMATQVARDGHRVLVLESGSITQIGDTHPLNIVEQVGTPYHGATAGRFRCLGGTSTRWGGALIPFEATDMTALPPEWDADWLGLYDDLLSQLPTAERLFDLPPGSYDGDARDALRHDRQVAFEPRRAKWPGFARRNVATLLRAAIEHAAGPTILMNATATGFDFADDGALAAIHARAPDGSTVTVGAPRFVFAAGAIESTRLLLLADRAAGDAILAPHNVVGRYFHDHLSTPVAEFATRDRGAFNRRFGFAFERGGMRNVRHEAAPALRRAHQLPAAFAHVAFESDVADGFDTLRLILRRIQRRELPAIADVGRVMRAAPYIAKVAWWRAIHRRLRYADAARLVLHMVTEQQPSEHSRITLSNAVDAYGTPIPRIDWRIAESDFEAMANVTGLFVDAWRETLPELAAIVPLDPDTVRDTLAHSGGIYHPGGSTRIGADRTRGVLDRDFCVFGIPNLTVAATSAFPAGGGANPTMMLVLATLRAASRISAELTGRN